MLDVLYTVHGESYEKKACSHTCFDENISSPRHHVCFSM